MNNLQQAMKRLEQSIHSRGGAAARAPGINAAANPAGQLALSLRPNNAPPPLFGAANDGGARAYLRDVCARLPNGRRISYRGEALHRDDWAVWSQLCEMLRRQAGERVEFAPRNLLKAMGWGVSVHDQNRLRDCLQRMQATSLKRLVERQSQRQELIVALSLIERCEWRPSPGGRGGRWRVWVAAEVQALFTDLN